MKLIFLIVPGVMSLLGLSRRKGWWKDAGILMLRHQLSVALRDRPRTRTRLRWPDLAWLALLAATVPIERLAGMRLIVTAGAILRWHRGIVRCRWARGRHFRMQIRLICVLDLSRMPMYRVVRCMLGSRSGMLKSYSKIELGLYQKPETAPGAGSMRLRDCSVGGSVLCRSISDELP